jgi:uncharacterized membrane protein YeaQ/YmgE (transglycosylase-associated protein family)
MARAPFAREPVGMALARWIVIGLLAGGLAATVIGASLSGTCLLAIAGALLGLGIRATLTPASTPCSAASVFRPSDRTGAAAGRSRPR